MMRVITRVCLLVVISTTALLLASTANASTRDPHACLNEGWQTYQADNGARFHSERGCIAYVKHGGTLFRPTVSLTVFCFENRTPPQLEVAVFLGDFHPFTSVTIAFSGVAIEGRGENPVFQGITDRDGFLAIQPPPIVPTSNAMTVTVTDAFGLQATSAPFLFTATNSNIAPCHH